MATAEQIKAWAFDRISAKIVDGDELGADFIGEIMTIKADVERDLKNADPSPQDERRSYISDCEDIAREALKDHPTDEDDQMMQVEESIDGDSWIIYYYNARKVLDFSGNSTHGLDDGLVTVDGCSDFDDLCTRLAWAAMRQDVMEDLQRFREERDEEIEEIVTQADAAKADCFVSLTGEDPEVHSLDLAGYLEALEAIDGVGEIWTAEKDGIPAASEDEEPTHRMIERVFPVAKEGK